MTYTPSGKATILHRGVGLKPLDTPPLGILLTHTHPPASQRMTGWMDAADTHGLAVAIPDCRGLNGSWYPFGESLDWLKAQLPTWLAALHADVARVYIAGFSAGGWMALYAALEGSMRLEGIAPVSAWSIPSWPRNRTRPIRLLSIMGDHDAYPWTGTPGQRDPALQTAGEFAHFNGYPAKVPTPTHSGTIDRYAWGAQTEFLLRHGGTHVWPVTMPDATPLIASWIQHAAQPREAVSPQSERTA